MTLGLYLDMMRASLGSRKWLNISINPRYIAIVYLAVYFGISPSHFTPPPPSFICFVINPRVLSVNRVIVQFTPPPLYLDPGRNALNPRYAGPLHVPPLRQQHVGLTKKLGGGGGVKLENLYKQQKEPKSTLLLWQHEIGKYTHKKKQPQNCWERIYKGILSTHLEKSSHHGRPVYSANFVLVRLSHYTNCWGVRLRGSHLDIHINI